MFWWRQQVEDGLWVGFTDASAGNMALQADDGPGSARANRSRLEGEMGISPGSLQFMRQVHSAQVRTVDAVSDSEPEADGLISENGRAPLAVLTADCLPIILAGRQAAGKSDGRYLTAAVHAGRRGLLDGIVSVAVERMRSLGGVELRAWIGPAVCGRCYEVPEELQREASRRMPALRSVTSWGTPALDLAAGARRQFDELGVPSRVVGGCTLESESLFSYRRDPRCGRTAGVVWEA